MTNQAALAVEPEDRLRWLRRLGGARYWSCLDDERCCRSCGRIFTGYDVRFVGGTRPLGPLSVTCPTPGCESTPERWVGASELQPRRVKRAISARVKVIRVLRKRRRRKQPATSAKLIDAIKRRSARWIEWFSSLITVGMRVPRVRGPIV